MERAVDHNIDPADLISFARRWSDMGDAICSQVADVMDQGNEANCNPNAIRHAIEKLERDPIAGDIVEALREWCESNRSELQAMIDDKPRFTHDCTSCVYLGADEKHDFYFCGQGGRSDTVIARFGNGGSEYASGLEIALAVKSGAIPNPTPDLHPLVKALKMARTRGLVSRTADRR